MLKRRVKYSYNKQGQVTTMAIDSAGILVQTYTMSYDSKGRLVQANSSRDAYLNEYNDQDQRVKQIRSYRGENGVLQEQDYYTFSYNSNNELAEARYFYSGSGNASLFYIWKYTYTNGNPTTMEQLSAREERITQAKLTYDTKPLLAQRELFTFFQPMEDVKTAHHLSSYSISNSHGGSSTYTLTYTFTPEGMAATAIKNGGQGFQEKRTYTYSCK